MNRIADPNNKARPTRSDDGHAFLSDPSQGEPATTDDDLAETLAEEFLMAATSAEEMTEDVRDSFVTEELGGPFLEYRVPNEDEIKREDR